MRGYTFSSSGLVYVLDFVYAYLYISLVIDSVDNVTITDLQISNLVSAPQPPLSQSVRNNSM